jgi:hypothetical protein
VIGSVAFERDGEPLVAVLDDSLDWSCEGARDIADALNAAFNVRRDYSPSRGRPGAVELHRVGRLLRGTVELTPRDEPEHERIY